MPNIEEVWGLVVALQATIEERERNRLERERSREAARVVEFAEVLRDRQGIDQRLASLEGKFDDWMPVIQQQLAELTQETKAHAWKASCINGGAKLLQGAGLTGGTGGGLVALYLLLKELGVL